MFEKLDALEAKFDTLTQKLSDPTIIANQERFREYAKSHAELGEIVEKYREYKHISQEIANTQELLRAETDRDMIDLAKEELAELEPQLETIEQELRMLLAPKGPNDEKNIVLEIRAGTGGEEAALFAADLFRMYSRYAEEHKWRIEVVDSNETNIGGFKEIIFMLESADAYRSMRFESGVHRVQRVPETESQGRVHTSAISVAVLPEADDVDVEINEKDLKIDVYRSSGHGGQSVNTTDSAVRITYLPTGLVVTCQDEKSQLKNKNKAMKVLRSRLLDQEIAKQEAEIAQSRRSQVGTGDRSAKIRTYNFPQSRVTDHRINLTSYKLNDILAGGLDEFIEALKLAYKNEKIRN